jgi:hypothetical protein
MNAPVAEHRRQGECATFGTWRRFRRCHTGGCHMWALGGRGHHLPGRCLDTKLQLTDWSRALWARDVVLSQTRGCRAYSCLAQLANGFLGFAPFWNVWLVELIPDTIFLRTHDNCAIRRSSKCPAGYSPTCVGLVNHDSRVTSHAICEVRDRVWVMRVMYAWKVAISIICMYYTHVLYIRFNTSIYLKSSR